MPFSNVYPLSSRLHPAWLKSCSCYCHNKSAFRFYPLSLLHLQTAVAFLRESNLRKIFILKNPVFCKTQTWVSWLIRTITDSSFQSAHYWKSTMTNVMATNYFLYPLVWLNNSAKYFPWKYCISFPHQSIYILLYKCAYMYK